ncbi:hypothetical protein HK097_009813 [Rhizophlyctis rosea]|uniref:DUF262 domain-containing protein n=1 Tax=Rhizophlyctis rosea TaxID=64517 RepID=A0AAD5SGC3_9FUNG|nr:hypothetical protein HK097_009813 [Rhizophlyctis rosea]
MPGTLIAEVTTGNTPYTSAIKDLRDCSLANLFGVSDDPHFDPERLGRVFRQNLKDSISPVFDRDVSFWVPEYQRRYTWGAPTVKRLIDDIAATCFGRNREQYYPIGTIVLTPGGGWVPNSFSIVDGQQRLTTLTLLIAVFRHLATNNDDKTKYSDWIQMKDQRHVPYRLRLQTQYDEVFCKFLDGSDLRGIVEEEVDVRATPIGKLMADNILAAIETIDTITGRDPVKRGDLAEFFFKQCRLLVIYTHNLHTAYRMFTTLNIPGIPLSTVDYLKAVILGKLENFSTSGVKLKARTWNSAENRMVSREAFSELVDHIYRIEIAKNDDREAFLESFQKALGNTESLYHHFMFESFDATTLLSCIDKMSNSWKAMINASSSKWSKVLGNKSRRHLIEFFELGNLWRTWATIALAAAEQNLAMVQEDAFWNKLDRLIAILIVSFKARGTGMTKEVLQTKLLEKFWRILKAVTKAGSDQSKILAALDPEADDVKCCERRLQTNLYTAAGRVPTLYILARINAHMSTSRVHIESWNDDIEVEHFYPQSPNDTEWPPGKFDSDNTHKLGNLALLPTVTNRECSNYAWKTKVNRYKSNGGGVAVEFAVTYTAMAAGEWNDAAFLDRHTTLMKYLVEIYNFEALKPRLDRPVAPTPSQQSQQPNRTTTVRQNKNDTKRLKKQNRTQQTQQTQQPV